MKKSLIILSILAFIAMNQKTFAEDYSKVTGIWKVEVPNAPYEYAKSTLTLTEEKGKLLAKVVFEDGTVKKPASVVFAKDTLSFTVTIDAYEIPLSGKLDKNKITGKVESPDGTLAFTATKK